MTMLRRLLPGFLPKSIARCASVARLGVAYICMACIGATSSANAAAGSDDTLAAQRTLFAQTRAQLRSGQTAAARAAMARLHDYPLYPYLELDELGDAIEQADKLDSTARFENTGARVDAFLKRYDGTVAAAQLREQWLDALGDNERWPQYLDNYRAASAGRQQQCWFIEALHQTGKQEQALLETDKVWLDPAMPDACDDAFARWLASKHRDEKLVWQRLQLALTDNDEKFARYLSVNIKAPYKVQAEYALMLLRDPSALADLLPRIAAQPEASATIALALKRLARRDLDQAQTLWLQTRAAGKLTPADNASVRRAIGRQQVAQNGADALPWLLQYDPDGSDSYLLQWRIRLALGSGDWSQIAHWITQLPPALADSSRWTYWRARALAQQHADPAGHKAGEELLAKLARERSYYGFLAADLQKKPYQLNDKPKPATVALTSIESRPAIVRAHEFFLLGDQADARREWQSALAAMNVAERHSAALLAERWDWYDQSIRGALQSGSYNDLNLRFPVGYLDSMRHAAKKTALPLHWLFAIARQESAFMPDARSRAGALGLMQLMPATARHVARGEHMRIDNYALLDPAVNIRLGSAYLRDLARRYDDNRVLATAAYNAGPSRISGVLREQNGPLRADIWIEQLPYRETREYVQSVLAFAVIYAQRLGKPMPLLTASEREITAQNLEVGSADRR